jgi:hypothetical protein
MTSAEVADGGFRSPMRTSERCGDGLVELRPSDLVVDLRPVHPPSDLAAALGSHIAVLPAGHFCSAATGPPGRLRVIVLLRR